MERVELEIHVAEGVTRRVTRDGQGLVIVFEPDGSEVARARWSEDKLDEKRVVKGAISRGQWGQIEGRLRAIEHRAELAKLQAGGDYLNFLLDPNSDRPPTPVLSVVKLVPGTWKVRVDKSGLLVITELAGDRLRVVATANYLPTRLRSKQIKNGTVTKEQWARVHAAVATVKALREEAVVPEVKPVVVATSYLTFLLDLADGDDDRIIEGSLHFKKSSDTPTGAFVWKVALDPKGAVHIHSLGMKAVGQARWTGTLVDRQQVTPQVPTEYQWAFVERALLLALERRAADPTPPEPFVEEPPPPPLPPIPSPNYRAFLLDIRDGAVVDNSVRFSPDPALVPERAFVWEVTLDGSTIRVEDWEGDRLATGSWRNGLGDTAQSGSIPTDAQWRMVRKALESVTGIPDDTGRRSDQAFVPAGPSSQGRGKRKPIFAIAGAGAVLVAGVIIFVAVSSSRETARPAAVSRPAPVAIQPPEPPRPPPPPPPPRETFATRLGEHRLRWADVAVPPETTIEQAEKEPSDEKGKRLCVEGTIENITRADRGSRRLYSGVFTTKAGDRVTFLVGGTTGQLVKRSAVTLCGVVTGFADGAVALEGLFDLPENRNPIVEKD